MARTSTSRVWTITVVAFTLLMAAQLRAFDAPITPPAPPASYLVGAQDVLMITS